MAGDAPSRIIPKGKRGKRAELPRFISYENGKTAVSVKHAVSAAQSLAFILAPRKCLSVCMWEARPQLEAGRGKEPDGSTCTWPVASD